MMGGGRNLTLRLGVGMDDVEDEARGVMSAAAESGGVMGVAKPRRGELESEVERVVGEGMARC